jgi:hypothetical protein
VTKPKQVKGLYEEKEKELQPGTIIKAARVARQERRAFMTTLRSSTCKKKLFYSSFSDFSFGVFQIFAHNFGNPAY